MVRSKIIELSRLAEIVRRGETFTYRERTSRALSIYRELFCAMVVLEFASGENVATVAPASGEATGGVATAAASGIASAAGVLGGSGTAKGAEELASETPGLARFQGAPSVECVEGVLRTILHEGGTYSLPVQASEKLKTLEAVAELVKGIASLSTAAEVAERTAELKEINKVYTQLVKAVESAKDFT
eukprot:6490357-Amphidinium_carterae.4